MNIKLTEEQMESVREKDYLIINGELWQLIEDNNKYIKIDDDGGEYYLYIYQRPSDNKYFKITIYYEYSFNDYEGWNYEFNQQDNMAYEVEKKPITKMEWINTNS